MDAAVSGTASELASAIDERMISWFDDLFAEQKKRSVVQWEYPDSSAWRRKYFINNWDGCGKSTLLDFSVAAGNLENVNFLLEAGADPNGPNRERLTIFMRCPIINGRSVQSLGSISSSAMHIDGRSRRYAAWSLLLSKGANVNASTSEFPYSRAVDLCDDLDAVDFLLRNGASPSTNYENKNGDVQRRISSATGLKEFNSSLATRAMNALRLSDDENKINLQIAKMVSHVSQIRSVDRSTELAVCKACASGKAGRDVCSTLKAILAVRSAEIFEKTESGEDRLNQYCEDLVNPKPRPEEIMPFSGQRCAAPVPLMKLVGELPPLARKAAECPKLDEASVQCKESIGRGGPVEVWSFLGCGNLVRIEVSNIKGSFVQSPPLREAFEFSYPPSSQQDVEFGRVGLMAQLAKQEKERRRIKHIEAAQRHWTRGRLIEARAEYAAAVAVDPKNPAAAENLKSVGEILQRVDRVVETYTTRIRRGDGSAQTLVQRGLAYIDQGDYGRGVEDLDSVEGLSGSEGVAVNRAWGYFRANEIGKAMNASRQILVEYSNNGDALLLLAWCSLLEGNAVSTNANALQAMERKIHFTMGPNSRAYALIVAYFSERALRGTVAGEAVLKKYIGEVGEEPWPALALQYLAGAISESKMLGEAERLSSMDSGNAYAEAVVFVTINSAFSSDWRTSRNRMHSLLNHRYRPAYPLAYRLIMNMSTEAPPQIVAGREGR